MHGSNILCLSLIIIFFMPHILCKSFFKELSSPGFLKNNEFIDNFYCVEKNALYRSGQLRDKSLEHYIIKYNIKTIINLRGKNEHCQWWRDEHDIAQKNNIEVYDISMSVKYLPSKENLQKLIEIYRNAPKPILIHCRTGSDRTGEAAAIWKIVMQNKNIKEALKQLSIKYWHFEKMHPAKKFLIKNWEYVKWQTLK